MNNQGDILQQLTPEQIMMLQALLSGSGGAPPQMMQQQAGMNPAARQKMIQELMRR